MGVTEKPVVKNVLVDEDHFTRFTQVYVTNKPYRAHYGARPLQRIFLSVRIPETTDV